MRALRVAFFGTPAFALPSLCALCEAGHDIARVYCQPPAPAGRGRATRPGPVHAEALARGLAVATPSTLKDGATHAAFQALGLDAGVVVAYGLLLPAPILRAPRLGCLNLHASLLPRWRGAAPIQHALLAGDKETGVTVMAMDEGLDTGPIVDQARLAIRPRDTAATLHDALAALGSSRLLAALEALVEGRVTPRAQPEAGASHAPKLDRAAGRLDWGQPAHRLDRLVRAFVPWPGAWFEVSGERLKVLAAEVVAAGADAAPGTVLDDRLSIACGEDALRLVRVQRSGRAPMDATAFLRGRPIPAGTQLPRAG